MHRESRTVVFLDILCKVRARTRTLDTHLLVCRTASAAVSEKSKQNPNASLFFCFSTPSSDQAAKLHEGPKSIAGIIPTTVIDRHIYCIQRLLGNWELKNILREALSALDCYFHVLLPRSSSFARIPKRDLTHPINFLIASSNVSSRDSGATRQNSGP